MMGFVSWLLGIITKLIIEHRHFHYRCFKCNDDFHPYLAMTGFTYCLVGMFYLVLDVFHYFGIRSIDFMNRAVEYFIVKDHTTIYSSVVFGLAEKPFRTKVFMGYLVIVLIAMVGAIGSSVDNNKRGTSD